MAVYRVLFPKGMDANEYALKVTPAHQSLGLALKRAEWLASASPRIGHVHLSTTQLYTQVSIRKLEQIHAATHPAEKDGAAEGEGVAPEDDSD
jgi:hypothetical protein